MDPEIVHLDFETALVNALSSKFGPYVITKGCFYYLPQSTWRKVQEMGISSAYKENIKLKDFCGMIDSLAFHPVSDLDEAMTYLKDNVPTEATGLF